MLLAPAPMNARHTIAILGLAAAAGACGNSRATAALDEVVTQLDARVVMYCQCIGVTDPGDIPRNCERDRYVSTDEVACVEDAIVDVEVAARYLACRADAERRFNVCVEALQCEPWRSSDCTIDLVDDTSACRALSPETDEAVFDCSEKFFANHPEA